MEVKGNFIVHGSYIDIHDNEVVNLSVDKAKVMVSGKEVNVQQGDELESTEDEEVLENHIFSPSIFDSNDKLVSLRNVIGNALENLHANNELYWVLAALKEADVLNFQTTDTDFLRQMKEWFTLHPIISLEINKLQQSISAEKSKWKADGKIVSLKNLKAKSTRLHQLKREKINRIMDIAYEGLYKELMQLR